MLCFDRPRMESPTQTTTIHGYLLPILHHSTPGVTPHVWWLSHYCISTEWCTPPTIQQSLLLAVCMTSPTMVTPAEEGSIASRSYTSGWLTHSHSLSTLTLNSHTHTHAARVRESSRVRTDGGTYILLDYYYCSYSIITQQQQQQQQQQQSTYARNSTLTATTCTRSTNSST